MGSKPHRILFFWHSLGNKQLTFLSNIFNNLNLTDMETCYKMFRSEAIKKIHLQENRFGFRAIYCILKYGVFNKRVYK